MAQDFVPLIDFFRIMLDAAVTHGKMAELRHIAAAFVDANDTGKGTTIERLARIEHSSIKKIPFNGEYDLYVASECLLNKIKEDNRDAGGWTSAEKKLTENYNTYPLAGGGVIDVLCIIHRIARKEIAGNDIAQIGCMFKGKEAISDTDLERIGLSRDAAYEIMNGSGCLYALKKK